MSVMFSKRVAAVDTRRRENVRRGRDGEDPGPATAGESRASAASQTRSAGWYHTGRRGGAAPRSRAGAAGVRHLWTPHAGPASSCRQGGSALTSSPQDARRHARAAAIRTRGAARAGSGQRRTAGPDARTGRSAAARLPRMAGELVVGQDKVRTRSGVARLSASCAGRRRTTSVGAGSTGHHDLGSGPTPGIVEGCWSFSAGVPSVRAYRTRRSQPSRATVRATKAPVIQTVLVAIVTDAALALDVELTAAKTKCVTKARIAHVAAHRAHACLLRLFLMISPFLIGSTRLTCLAIPEGIKVSDQFPPPYAGHRSRAVISSYSARWFG